MDLLRLQHTKRVSTAHARHESKASSQPPCTKPKATGRERAPRNSEETNSGRWRTRHANRDAYVWCSTHTLTIPFPTPKKYIRYTLAGALLYRLSWEMDDTHTPVALAVLGGVWHPHGATVCERPGDGKGITSNQRGRTGTYHGATGCLR